MIHLVQRFARNPVGRDLIVGDIHGHFTKLQAALDAVGFNPDAGDRLFSVGDLVDRGPESMLALEWLAKPWFHAVAGNHEVAAIEWAAGNLQLSEYNNFGAAWNIGNTPPERLTFADAFEAMPIAIELDTATGLVGIVHADCPTASWQEFTSLLESPHTDHLRVAAVIGSAQWSRDRADNLMDDGVAGVRAVVVGHTPMERWTSLGNVIFIDTGAWLPGRRAGPFTLLDAATLRPAEAKSSLVWESTP